MKTEHTPGPWEVYHTQHGMKWIGNADRVTAATVEASERQAADVALICAAPDLLAAIVSLLPLAVHTSPQDVAVYAARAAIAKAKGGAQ